MKKITYILLSVFFFMTSCEDPFDLTPTDIISDAVVFEDEGLADAFLVDLYRRTLWHYKSGQSGFDINLINAFGGESRNFAPWQAPFGQVMDVDFNENGARALSYWPYQLIRECNVFIEKLPESQSLSDEYIKTRSSEARFIRAFSYFEMVKRYGGVPLVLEALSADASAEELFVPRNSEKEVYDFIGSEMDAISGILPSEADQYGRINKWTALALKSRAMLYAASISNFGSVQLNGILGFPAAEANQYYQKSMQASREIMMNGPFALYRKNSDPVQNFEDLFVDENDNPEVIFAELYDLDANKTHSWDQLATPADFGFSWNSNYPTYLETLELFDFVDGSSGKVDRAMYDDKTAIDPDWYFGQRDPRMRASIFYPGAPFKGGTVFFHRSTDFLDPASGEKTRSTAAGIIPVSDYWPGSAHPRLRGSNATGLLIRKRINQASVNGVGSDQDYIVFRLAEIMLNYVEAAFYLGDPNGDMTNILNDEIRDRAGMPELSPDQITEEKIRQERRVELAFENQVFWDLRRWRIAVDELHNKVKHRMHFRYDFDNETYTIAIADGDKGRIRLHPERNYYYALGLSRLADNPNLVENPGY